MLHGLVLASTDNRRKERWEGLATTPAFLVLAAFEAACARLPFAVAAVHTDNGTAFMNAHVITDCHERGIALRPSREFKTNDHCVVEQKNGSVARRFQGYARFDTDQAWKVMQELDATVSVFVNVFLPSQKLVSKTRQGSKVRKHYDRPQTPLQRVLSSCWVSEESKNALRQQALTLNPASLARTINRLRAQLMQRATPLAPAPPQKRAVDGAALRQAGSTPPNPTLPHPWTKP